jgi:NAD(P)-dependent dehydrogenase (short-subunit alcohol dehydrogenase family)
MPKPKIFLITGATNGIGKAAAQAIAAQGGHVVIAGRDARKTEAVAAELRRTSDSPDIDYLLADLSSMAEVRRLAAEFTARYDWLDVLVNNAGAFFMRRQETVDGLEMTFALNHLSYFLLTNLLLDMLKASAPARGVNVTSAAESNAKLDWDDLQLKRKYRGFEAYALSKRFNLYFTYELARRLEGTGITVNAVHPGTVATGIWANPFGPLSGLAKPFTRLAMRSPEQGAETVVHVATAPEVAGVTGRYFADRQAHYSSRASQDPEAARRAWQVSGTLCGHHQSSAGLDE